MKALRICKTASNVFFLLGCLMIFPPNDSILHDVFQLCFAAGMILFATYRLRKNAKEGEC